MILAINRCETKATRRSKYRKLHRILNSFVPLAFRRTRDWTACTLSDKLYVYVQCRRRKRPLSRNCVKSIVKWIGSFNDRRLLHSPAGRISRAAVGVWTSDEEAISLSASALSLRLS